MKSVTEHSASPRPEAQKGMGVKHIGLLLTFAFYGLMASFVFVGAAVRGLLCRFRLWRAPKADSNVGKVRIIGLTLLLAVGAISALTKAVAPKTEPPKVAV